MAQPKKAVALPAAPRQARAHLRPPAARSASSGRRPAPPVLGAAGSHATSAGISCPHCSFKELRMRRMRRRQFIGALGGAVAWPLVVGAQQASTPVVGYVYGGTAEGGGNQTAGFGKGLSESGFIEGRNVIIQYRYAETDYNQLPEIVADLVRRRVAVIATITAPAALAAKSFTTTIPIVFGTGGDPVLQGLVTSLNRPGGNLTGFSFMTTELTAKRLGLMRELLAGAGRIRPADQSQQPGHRRNGGQRCADRGDHTWTADRSAFRKRRSRN